MALYPSLEDMKLDQLRHAQNKVMNAIASNNVPTTDTMTPNVNQIDLYPALGNYMGLEFSEQIIAENMPEYSIAIRQTVC